MPFTTLETPRLRLRQWEKTDLAPFAQLNADPEVMHYFPATLSRVQSDEMADVLQAGIKEQGFGFWATELKANREFIGFVGLFRTTETLPPAPCVEIGWRLARQYWGNGYATEAATASLEFAFTQLELEDVVSFAVADNFQSRAVMERIGLRNTDKNFLHPAIDENHPFADHVLYRITRAEWLSSQNQRGG